MAILELYDHEFRKYGWFDAASVMPGWMDHELGDSAPILLVDAEMSLFLDGDLFILLQGPGTPYHTPHGDIQLTAGITVELTAALFDDPDTFFVPIAIRALKQSDQMLRNEVRRVR